MTTLGGPNQILPPITFDEDDLDEGSANTPLELEICDRYLALCQDPLIRFALSNVVTAVVDGKNTIDVNVTRKKLTEWLTVVGWTNFENSQLHLRSFLNCIWYVECESLSLEFWWEHRRNILKLLYIASIVDAFKLQANGVTSVKGHHLPRAALFIYDYIASLEEDTFAEMEEDFSELSKEHSEFCQTFNECFVDGKVAAVKKPAAKKNNKTKHQNKK